MRTFLLITLLIPVAMQAQTARGAGEGPTQTPAAPPPGAPAGQPGRGGRGGAQGTPVLGPNGEVWGFTDTAFNPGSRWRIHDAQRPQPDC